MTTFTADTVTRTVEYVIEGAEPMTMSYGDQQFTPRCLVVTVERLPDVDWYAKTVVAYGPRLLKSGKDGQESRERDLMRAAVVNGQFDHVLDSDAPQWVSDCIAHTIKEAQ